MAGAIYCGFARVAVYTNIKKYTTGNNWLQTSWKESFITEYNSVFRGYPKMQLSNDPKNISKRVTSLRECFSRRWNPASTKEEYLRTFSLDAWNSLSFPFRSIAIKRKHPISTAVDTQAKKIRLSQQATPTSSKREIDRKILRELNPLC